MRRLINLLLVVCAMVSAALADDAPHLPPASHFHLTLVESPQSKVPLGPSCTGEAALTLTCRAFTMTLEYAGENPVRLVWSCSGPDIAFDEKAPNSSSGWWRVSWPHGERCAPGTITNVRLKPGERTQFAVRLKGSSQFAQEFLPGPHTLRTVWILWGCTDKSDADDCFTPLEAMDARRGPYTPSRFQEPIEVVSNEVTANAPQMPDLGSPKFSFEVAIRPDPPGKNLSSGVPGCDGKARGSIDCVFFHYKLHNVGDRPVRDSRLDCSDASMTVEYRVAGGEWKPLPQSNRSWVCTLNVPFEMPILPGQTGERDFILSALTPGYDTTALQAAGEYGLRFTFWPMACIASPDASFCLTHPQHEPSVTSSEVFVRMTAGSSGEQSASPHD